MLIKATDRFCNTRDFLASGRLDKAREYFHAAACIYRRLAEERDYSGPVYDACRKDRLALEQRLK